MLPCFIGDSASRAEIVGHLFNFMRGVVVGPSGVVVGIGEVVDSVGGRSVHSFLKNRHQ